MRKFKIDKEKSKIFGYSTVSGIGMGLASYLFGSLQASSMGVVNDAKGYLIGYSMGIVMLSIPAFYGLFKPNKMEENQEKSVEETKNMLIYKR